MKKIAFSLLALTFFISAAEENPFPGWKPFAYERKKTTSSVQNINDFDGDGSDDVLLHTTDSVDDEYCIFSGKNEGTLYSLSLGENRPKANEFQSKDYDGDGFYELYYKNVVYYYSEETPNSKN